MSFNLQQKLEESVEHFKEVEKALTQAQDNVKTLERALEQARGRATVFDELLQEQQASDAESVQKPELQADGELVVAKT